MSLSLLWFRQDLRLHDNPALYAAVEHKSPIIPFYIFDDTLPANQTLGQAQQWWLHHSLMALNKRIGGHLVLRKGKTEIVLESLLKETGASHVFWNRCYEPAAIQRDKDIKEKLKHQGIKVSSFNSHLLREPWVIKNLQQKPYKVFTQFWKHYCTNPSIDSPLPVPSFICWAKKIPSDTLEHWKLLPSYPDWAKDFPTYWVPGEEGALAKLDVFLEERLQEYKGTHDRPDQQGTSQLSPHLHFGEVSVRLLWERLNQPSLPINPLPFLRQLGWREFSYYLLYHFPHLSTQSFKPAFENFPWSRNTESLLKWQKGLTGYPIIDAGMRELWVTGWMHNRVRMIVASFLVKDLLVDWREGQAWFHNTLLDADLANNAASWQWVAGSGADAAPYFRIFNPVLQGEKFDPVGKYVKKWVPALKSLPSQWIHRPFEAPPLILKDADITLGVNYPLPLVDHKAARTKALSLFETIKNFDK